MATTLLIVLGLLVGIYLLLMVGIAWFSLHPVRTPVFFSPGMLGAPQENWDIQSEGLRLRGWWIPADGATTVAVLSHGYLMNRSELAPLAYTLWRRGISCLLLDLRAHGRSQGKQSYLGYREAADVLAGIRAARAEVPGARVVLIGSSMGSAASVFAAEAEPGTVDALILDSCYSRLSSAILGWWRLLGGRFLETLLWPTTLFAAPIAGFNPFEVDVSRALGRAGDVPVLILHGEKDDLALPAEAERNRAACTGPTEIVWLADCGHSEGRWERPVEYDRAVLGFLTRHGLLEGDQNVATPTS
ncbi:MAG: alpha/beta hydrolase [Fimbriimonas sp.]